ISREVKQDTLEQVIWIQNTVAASFDDLNLIIQTFHKPTCLTMNKVIQYLLHPLLQCPGRPEWHSVKRHIFSINPLRCIIPHAFRGRPLRLAGQSSLDSLGVQFAPLDGQYSGQVGLASPKRYAG